MNQTQREKTGGAKAKAAVVTVGRGAWFCLVWLWRLVERIVRAAPTARTVFSSKHAAWHWLKKAYKAQLVLAVCAIFGLLAIEPIAKTVADWVHPPVVKLWKKRTIRVRASRELGDTIERYYWIGAGVSVLVLLWLELPLAAAWYQKERRRQQGGALPEADPLASNAATLVADGNLSVSLAERSRARSSLPAPGERYEVIDTLGAGGMGVVYRARDSVLGRIVALKALPAALVNNEVLVTRFREEARVVARLQHPNIVQVFDLVEDEESLYMAMELVEGSDLAAHLAQRGPLVLAEALGLAVPLAEAMAYAHDQGVIHRDLKPHNVLIGQEGTPKITDFGLAKGKHSPHLTQAGAVLGSPNYLSPEQAAGNPTDERTDIYAFACTLYEMLAGRPPFVGEMIHVLMQHVSEPPPPVSEFVQDLPEELVTLLAEMMSKDPNDRPAKMDLIIERLEKIAAQVS